MTRPGMTQPGIARPTRRSLMTALCAACLLFPSPAAATPVYRPDNGHYYEVVHGNGVDWSNAKAAAESLTYAGSKGHLVTITDQGKSVADVHFWRRQPPFPLDWCLPACRIERAWRRMELGHGRVVGLYELVALWGTEQLWWK